ncbi:MAG: MotA/TolQ/ExbB proton channel family protein [Planctomycetota bacterium]|jgi:biopolymer transport protein ExbB|nr:MotA/TolQ/ExbB proton channel family protein [Planctomycetota bacterium]
MRTRPAIALALVLLAAASPARADELAVNSLLTVFEKGGELMWAILASSVIGCGFVAERLLAIRRGAQIPKRVLAGLRDAMASGGVPAGVRVVEGDKSAMGRIMHVLLSRSGATRRELEEVVEDEGARILFDLRANLRPVAVVVSLAPMLGLMGTVFGLIEAFRAAAELGMDDPRNFAAGIYVALYTTAFGLVVAVAMLIAHHYLRGRADTILREVEEKALAFISAASSRAGGRRPAAGPPPAEEGALAASEETSVAD